MKKLLALAISFSLLISSVTVAPVFAACGDGNTHGQCGAAGECPGGEICIDGWGWNDAKCQAATTGQCDNKDDSKEVICGSTWRADKWCGASGGCASGYRCDASTFTCVNEPQGCTNTSGEEGVQCGKWRTGYMCGASGGCADGLRCIPNSEISGTGYACLNQADNDGALCPGAVESELPDETLICTGTSANANATCNCDTGSLVAFDAGGYCCGFAGGDICYASSEEYREAVAANPSLEDPDLEPIDESSGGGSSTPVSSGGESTTQTNTALNIFQNPDAQDFADLNPLVMFGDSDVTTQLSSPGGIVSRVLLFAFPIAGLILFVMLVWAGFEILANAPNGKSLDAGKQRATAAVVGFILLFCTYWLMQIVEYVFGIVVL